MGFSGGDVRVLDFTLRLCVIPFSVASIWIALNAKQNNPDYGELGFKNFIGLKYMVCISAISAGYALFAAVSSYLKCLVTKAWFFFVTDQVVAYLMVTSVSALGEFLYLAYNGDQMVSWSRACASYGNFCSRLKLAMILHAIAVCCFLVLAVISAYRNFRRFQPPLITTKDSAEQEMTS